MAMVRRGHCLHAAALVRVVFLDYLKRIYQFCHLFMDAYLSWFGGAAGEEKPNDDNDN